MWGGSALSRLGWRSCCVHAVSPCVCPLCPAVSPPDLRQIRLACHEGFPLTGTLPLKCFINPFYFKLFIGNATKHHICQPGSIKGSRRKASPSLRSFKEAQSRSLRLRLNLSSLIMFSRLWAAEMICDESGGNPGGA